jgi:hypothetical protein
MDMISGQLVLISRLCVKEEIPMLHVLLSRGVAFVFFVSPMGAKENRIICRCGSADVAQIAAGDEPLHQFSAPRARCFGRLRPIHEVLEVEVVRLCLSRQHDKALATVSGVIDFLSLKETNINRFLVQNFVQREKSESFLRRHLSRKFSSFTGLKQFFCRALPSSG